MTVAQRRTFAARHWPLQIYGLAFTAAVILCLALKPAHTFSTMAFVAALATAGIVFRLFTSMPIPLVLLVVVTAVALVGDPLGVRMFSADGPVARAVQASDVYPECFVLLVGARLISEWTRQVHVRQDALPFRGSSATTEQPFTAALLTGTALMILTFALVPPLDAAPSALSVGALLHSALQGSTQVHVAILLASGTAIALIGAGFVRYVREWRAFVRLRRAANEASPSKDVDVADWVASHAGRYAQTSTAVYLTGLLAPSRGDLRMDAVTVHHDAARQFLRRLLGLLPLLGFLGTIVGLAAAIAGLPRGLSGGGDLTASLGGLAIKFETTFLGLVAYLVGSLATNLLDRLEADATAGLLELAGAIDAARH